jgi:hypothetical protein
MKTNITFLALTIILGLTHYVSFAQENNEAEIRNFETMEGQAWVKKDSAILFKLFSPHLVVNTPLNKVATLDVIKMLMRMGKIDISYSEKIIEKISFINDMAIVMGRDIVKPQGAMENAGKTVTKQYTDVWIKDKTGWRLSIRQATNISIE